MGINLFNRPRAALLKLETFEVVMQRRLELSEGQIMQHLFKLSLYICPILSKENIFLSTSAKLFSRHSYVTWIRESMIIIKKSF